MSFVKKKKCYLQLVAKISCKQQFFFLMFVSFHVFKCLEYDHMPNFLKIDSKTHIYVFLLTMGRNMVSKVIVCMITSHNDSLWSWMLF